MVTAAEFLDPGGAAGLPECLEETLGDLAGARALAANARGSLLAGAGRGGCAVWDLSTRGVVRRPGAGAAAAVEWTRDGRRLMVAGGDGAVKLVDVESGEVQVALDLGFPIIGASLEPDGRVCVAWGAVGPPTFCDLRTRDTCRMRLPSLDAKADIAKSDGLRFVARFPQRGGGGLLFTGNSRGLLSVVGYSEGSSSGKGEGAQMGTRCGQWDIKVLSSTKVRGGPAMKVLEVHRDGESLLAVCHDRCIRRFGLERKPGKPPILTLLTEYDLETKERCRWGGVGFIDCKLHPDAPGGAPAVEPFVVAATAAEESRHNLYFFHLTTGLLERVLEGPKGEGAVSLVVLPGRLPIVATISSGGQVYMWSKRFVENWSAFAPNFTVLENNSEHREKETEFDANPPEPAAMAMTEEIEVEGDPAAPVDILGAWPPRAPGDDEVEGCLASVSIFPDKEEVAGIKSPGSKPGVEQGAEAVEAVPMVVP